MSTLDTGIAYSLRPHPTHDAIWVEYLDTYPPRLADQNGDVVAGIIDDSVIVNWANGRLIGYTEDPSVLSELGGIGCAYCDARVWPNPNVPDVDDDDAWRDLSLDHADGCEWIMTRAHRVPDTATV